VIIILLSQCGIAIASPNEKTVLERTIGALLLSHDQKLSYQNGPVAFAVDRIYNEFFEAFITRIKGLPVEDRVSFFWFAMWHLTFDGHIMMQFEKLVEGDCGDQFIARLEKYIATESKLKRNKGRLFLSKKVPVGI
jgi:hypothetical protein